MEQLTKQSLLQQAAKSVSIEDIKHAAHSFSDEAVTLTTDFLGEFINPTKRAAVYVDSEEVQEFLPQGCDFFSDGSSDLLLVYIDYKSAVADLHDLIHTLNTVMKSDQDDDLHFDYIPDAVEFAYDMIGQLCCAEKLIETSVAQEAVILASLLKNLLVAYDDDDENTARYKTIADSITNYIHILNQHCHD